MLHLPNPHLFRKTQKETCYSTRELLPEPPAACATLLPRRSESGTCTSPSQSAVYQFINPLIKIKLSVQHPNTPVVRKREQIATQPGMVALNTNRSAIFYGVYGMKKMGGRKSGLTVPLNAKEICMCDVRPKLTKKYVLLQ